jgi:monoterpene epsilon-lactone hydrolase
MPKLVSSLVHAQIMLLNPLLKRMDLKSSRKLQDALGAIGATALAGSVAFEDESFDVFDAAWAVPRQRASGGAVLYLHGGAYTAGCLAYAKGFGGVLAEETGLSVLCAGYRLAPEHPFPAALEDALCAYRRMLRQYPPEKILLAGESAGGGLCYCLCLRLKALGLPQPAGVVAVSPWADLTLAAARSEEESADPALSREGLAVSAALYAGDNLSDPEVSPVFGDLRGLPPSLIFAGSGEVLLGDAEGMAQRLRAQGCRCALHVEEGMWHAYVLYPLPESKAALRRIAVFAEEIL